MSGNKGMFRRILAAALCLCLLLGTAVTFAEGAVSNVTDAQGPKLSDFKIEQNKKTLKPGDTLKVSMRATDRSGISRATVSFYTEKSGERTYFSVSMNYDAETDRFVGEIVISDSQIAGTYYVNYISAYDQYNNEKYITTSDKNTYLGWFKVKATTKALKGTVKIKENGQTVKPGDVIHVTVNAKTVPANTDRIGVSLRNQVNETSARYTTIYCYYNESTKKFESRNWTFGESMPNGTYELTEMEAYDDDYNTLASVTVSGQSVTLADAIDDLEGPKIQSAKLKQKGKTLKAGDTVHVEAKVKDSSGVRRVSAYLHPQNTNWQWIEDAGLGKGDYRGSIYFELENISGTKWAKDFVLPDDIANGKYYLEISTSDKYYNYSWQYYEKQYFTFKGDDYVTDGIRDFISQMYDSIQDKTPTEAQINDLGLKLASGKAFAVQTVKAILEEANLSKGEQVSQLYLAMAWTTPSAAELADWTAKLESGTSVEKLIDELAKTKYFRQMCNDAKIKAGSFGVNDDGVEIGDKAVKKIKLNKKSATLKVKKTLKLKATVKPADATDASVTWSSSNPSVATVSKKGKVKAVGAGTCVITCAANDGSGIYAECTITVEE